MTTGSAWNIDTPEKPVALFDPDAIRDIPVEIGDWLDSMGTTYASHEVLTAAPLQCLSSAHDAGVVLVRMSLVASPAYSPGTKYPFTLRIVGADGQQDDRTLWLKIKDR